jgi:ice-binding like protein
MKRNHYCSARSSSPIARAVAIAAVSMLTAFASACGSRDASSPNSLASIAVSPDPQTLAPGATVQLTATGTDEAGNPMPITPTWSVVNSGGSVDASSGLFTAGSTTGTFAKSVKASSGGKSGAATIIVAADASAPIADLRTAAVNGIMAGTAVTCVTGGTISANVSVSPGNTLTGFGPCVITGVRHLGDAVALQAQNDLTTAYNTLAGLPCDADIVADLGGTTLLPGVYCTGSSIGVTGTVTLNGNGDPNSTFVFQAGTGLTTAGNVVLINGAQAKNVWWQVGSSATLGTSSQWKGNIVALTSITLVADANLVGRALARNGAVSLGSRNSITLP